jgi:hypothetical protein
VLPPACPAGAPGSPRRQRTALGASGGGTGLLRETGGCGWSVRGSPAVGLTRQRVLQARRPTPSGRAVALNGLRRAPPEGQVTGRTERAAQKVVLRRWFAHLLLNGKSPLRLQRRAAESGLHRHAGRLSRRSRTGGLRLKSYREMALQQAQGERAPPFGLKSPREMALRQAQGERNPPFRLSGAQRSRSPTWISR